MNSLSIHCNSHTYPIYIGKDIFQLVAKHINTKRALVVSTNTIANHYLKKLQQALPTINSDVLLIDDGERNKSVTTWQTILATLAKQKHHRDTTLIALGGGMVGDVTGFAAACYMRGVNFIQIPTTLLAQIDASIGGKTAINIEQGKNLVGAFHQPQAVCIDIDTLKTLPTREYNSGIAEMIKHALIADRDYFEWLEQNIDSLLDQDEHTLQYAIKRSCEIKANIITQDEQDHGIRQLLNFGHTFGHAIETASNYELLHGEAVAIGIVKAAELSLTAREGITLNQDDIQRIKAILTKANLPTSYSNTNALEAHMQLDKKIKNNQQQFILLAKIGEAYIQNDTTVI